MTSFVHAVTEYVLNSLWQAPLLCAVAWVLARTLRRVSSQAEHCVWVGCLLAQCLLPACVAPGLARLLHRLFLARDTGGGIVTVALGSVTPHAGAETSSLLRFAVLLYVLVTAVLVFRFASQCWQVHVLRRQAEEAALAPEHAAFLQRCCAHLRIAEPAIATATVVETPLALGVMRSALLLPEHFLERVTTEQLHTALSHELAHLARRDPRKHLLYRLISLSVAYHPAVQLTLANLAETRERVCDRLAATVTGDPRSYARCLLELALLLTAQRPAQSNAIGLFDANQFERRISMLNRQKLPIGRPLRLAILTGCMIAATAVCTSALAMHVDVAQTEQAPAPNGPDVIAPGVAAGMIVSKTVPVYPQEAKDAKVSGVVILSATIGKTGKVDQLRVVSGPEMLRQSALQAVSQWVYKPYLRNGVPTEVSTMITVHYSFAGSPVPPDPPTPQSPDAGIAMPTLIKSVDAEYPVDARRQKISGEVMVGLQVLQDGSVSDVTALAGPAELREAATAAVKQYRFRPATMEGQPVAVGMQVSVHFETF